MRSLPSDEESEEGTLQEKQSVPSFLVVEIMPKISSRVKYKIVTLT